MQQQSIPVTQKTSILINVIPGNLRVAGWDRQEIMAKTDGDTLEVLSESDPITISCDEDLILYLPRETSITVESVNGDASLQALHGSINLGKVAGDVALKDTNSITIETVAGDISLVGVGAIKAGTISGDAILYRVRGDCAIESIGGDVSARDVSGSLSMEAGSDIYIRNIKGSITVNAGSDIAAYVNPTADQVYTFSAGDDITLRLPPDADASLTLTVPNPESIRIDIPGKELDESEGGLESLTLGSGTAKLTLIAGDGILVTSRAEHWDSTADFGFGMFDNFEMPIPPIPPIPHIPHISGELEERIHRRVQHALERAQTKVGHASRRAEIKIEAAVRRADAKARAAETRARHVRANVNIGRWKWDLASQSPVEKSEPVSDEERLTILQMLQEKKITLEEAEKLLSALEGK